MSTESLTAARGSAKRQRGSDYAALMARVRQAGLLERRPVSYTIRIAINALFLIGTWVMFVALGETWWQMLTAALMAVAFTQCGFLGHEAGHQQIFRSRPANRILGLLHGNLAIGLAYGWWVDKHNRHHAHPNQEGLDPDIASKVLIFVPDDARGIGGARGWFNRNQARLFFPLLFLEGISLHVAGFRAVFGRAYPGRRTEGLLLLLHTAAYLTAVFLVLPPVMALAFIAVQQGLFGFYLGCSFAPNHKGMAILSRDDDSDFLRRQVLTSRNVTGGRVIDAMLGGLNYQIEHHLFPSMPRDSLRRAQPIVRAYCEEHGIPYTQTGLFDSYRRALRHLHIAGNPAA
jgi:fatty acid desaturase